MTKEFLEPCSIGLAFRLDLLMMLQLLLSRVGPHETIVYIVTSAWEWTDAV